MSKLTTSEAKAFINCDKFIDNSKHELSSFEYPISGTTLTVSLLDKQENNYLLDIRQAVIQSKHTKQLRVFNNNVLVRLDFGHYHTNPIDVGGEKLGSPHIHVYHEDYDDRIAYEVMSFIQIDSLDSKRDILNKFIDFIHLNGTKFIADLLNETLP
jgi:hypothetical protein